MAALLGIGSVPVHVPFFACSELVTGFGNAYLGHNTAS